MYKNIEDHLLGCFLGLAVGDAVGATLEFRQRDTYDHITDMVGGGPFDLKPGQWTDDTSMAICLAESLLAFGRVDSYDLRERWRDWWHNGTNSSTGRCFDIGAGTAQALRTGKPGGEGNGSIMRLAPVVLMQHDDRSMTVVDSILQSAVTHDGIAGECAAMLGCALWNLAHGKDIGAAVVAQRTWLGDWTHAERHEISSSGYCVDTLRAALWCLHRTMSFREAVLLAANLGDDADTVAAVTGQLAGAKYGRSGIPQPWLSKLHDGDRLVQLAHRLVLASGA